MRHSLAAWALALATIATPATAETLVVSISRDNVLIQSNFTGERLAVFGVIEREADAEERGRPGLYDAVVTVRGPRGAVTVRRKEQWGPMWLNLDERKFIAIPAFLRVLSNRGLPLIAPQSLREELRLGLDVQIPEQTAVRGANDPRFREALQRLRLNQKLFAEDATAVRFIAPNVFQASLDLPGTAPLGNYDIDVAIISNGVLVARGSTGFRVAKTAVEQTMASLAADHGVIYGLLSSFAALLIGWLASVVFRRD